MKRLAVIALTTILVFVGVVAAALWRFTSMPGDGDGAPPAPRDAVAPTEAGPTLAARLRASVTHLAGTIGERSVYVDGSMNRAADWITERLTLPGLGVVVYEQPVVARSDARCIQATRLGRDPEAPTLVVGAHYDAFQGTVGANDNASGVAAMIELARTFAARDPSTRTVRFVAFPNEEPPWFQNDEMGSLRYASRLRDRGESVAAMISLESLGYYDDAPGSQQYPAPLAALYPDRGNFVAFVGDVTSGGLVRDAIEIFRRGASIPSEGASLPAFVPGVGWSDHWSFWQIGVPAFMVTDTATFRDPTYHTSDDVPEHLDYTRMARVVEGMIAVVESLAAE